MQEQAQSQGPQIPLTKVVSFVVDAAQAAAEFHVQSLNASEFDSRVVVKQLSWREKELEAELLDASEL